MGSPSAEALLQAAEEVTRLAAEHMRNVADAMLEQNKIDSQEHAWVHSVVDNVHGALDGGRY